MTNSRISASKRITRTKPNTFWFILGPLTVFPSFPYNEPGEVIVKKLSSQWESNFKGDLFLNWWNEPILAKTEVYLPEYDFMARAKIDTGAKNSSIHAVDVEYIGQPGNPEGSRIRFKTMDANGVPHVIEADVLRQVRIKRADSLIVTRPEIAMEIYLARIKIRIRINLTNRAGMLRPMCN